MGIYGALSSAVTGLRAQAHALENISGNIANSQTTGYKRIETDFLDLIPDAPISRQVPGAVLSQSRGTNDIGGDIKTVSNETFIALNSNGFFVVEPKTGQSDGKPVFSGSNFYTRRGDFEIDKDGMLVNGAGYYLKGLPIDTTTGNVSGSVPEVIKLSNAFLPAQRTGRIDYQANLPQIPKTTSYNALVPGSELLNTGSYLGLAAADTGITIPGQPATVTGRTFAAATNPVSGADDAINNGFVAGQTVSFGAAGQTVIFQFRATGGPAVTPPNIEIELTANRKTVNVLAEMELKLQAAGPQFGSATVGVVDGKLAVSMGSNVTDSLVIGGGTGATSLGLVEGTQKPPTAAQRVIGAAFVDQGVLSFTANTVPPKTVSLQFYTPPGTASAGNVGVSIPAGSKVGDVLASMQEKLRSQGGAAFSTATVSIDATGQIGVSMGTNKTNNLTVAGAGATALGINGAFQATRP
ncbi:flagellar hook-basal body complex protein, partial [Devosia psychrophila]|uniref:flagellar hook-basal body complex protein n=1 Tax=Devosia psychrophila TaxID=728005 RepID=UPI000A5EEB57